MISPLAQSVAYALITKSVGSGFRVVDDLKAPNGIKANTLGREATLLGLTTVFTTALQKLLTPVIQSSAKLMRNELLVRAIFTAPALAIAEHTSRLFYPKHKWDKVENGTTTSPSTIHQDIDDIHDDDDDFDDDFENTLTERNHHQVNVKNHPQTTWRQPILYNASNYNQFQPLRPALSQTFNGRPNPFQSFQNAQYNLSMRGFR